MRFSPFLANLRFYYRMPRKAKPITNPPPEEKNMTEKPKKISKSKKQIAEPTKIRIERGDFFIEFK
jgi:hypothetical protein